MSDFARLEDKLAKLRQRERVSGEGRRLRGTTPEALLAAVVTEIDETILPRRLTFHVEDGAEVHLAVANRRLQALSSPAPDIEGTDAAGLADKPLPDAEAPEVSGVRDVLLAAFAEARPVAIQSMRPPGGGYPSDVGVPSNILARAWGVAETSQDELSPDELISRFLESLGDDAEAWLRIEGENVTAQNGDDVRLEALGEQAAVFLDAYFGKFDALYPQDAGNLATIIGPANGKGTAAVFVEAGEVTAFVAARAGRVAQIATLWQRLSGG